MKSTLVASVVLASAALAGCAGSSVTPDDFADLKKQVSSLKDGNADAMSKADAAMTTAKSAQSDAAAALSAANEAKAMSSATDSKIDQMFKKAMYK